MTLAWVVLGALGVACALSGSIAVARGGSMEPTLVRGDVCLVARRLDARVRDIVVYRRPGQGVVMHRVVDIEANGDLCTRGDANVYRDREPVPPSCVRGRVVAVFPLGRAARGWMRSVRGATLLTQSR